MYFTKSTNVNSGNVYNDANANGVRDTGEVGISGRRVYLDANNNGAFNIGETSMLTDASGNYSFNTLPNGPYHVRTVLPTSGWRLTAPTGGVYNITLGTGTVATGNS